MATFTAEARMSALTCLLLPACLYVWPVRGHVVPGDDPPPGSSGPRAPTGSLDDVTPAEPVDDGCRGVEDAAAPALFFSDLRSGPNVGGEDGLGAYVTLYGMRLGSERGTSRITLGGVEVDRYVSWNPALDHHPDPATRALPLELERVTVQLGPNARSGNFVLWREGRPSNPLSFTVRQGLVLFADGNALSDGDGSPASPFRSLRTLKRAMRPGAIAYLSGTFTEADADSTQSVSVFLDAATAPTGTEALPVAFVGHPLAPTARIEGPSTGVAYGTLRVEHYVFSNLEFGNTGSSFDMGSHLRVIGSRFKNLALTRSKYAILGNGDFEDLSLLGNIFFGDDGGAFILTAGTLHGVEIAWNEMRALSAGYPTISTFASSLSAFAVHDNLFVELGVAVALGPGTKGALVFNNVFAHLNSAVTLRNEGPYDQAVRVLHNTTVSAGPIESASANQMPARIENNILSGSSGQYVVDPHALISLVDNFYDTTLGDPLPPAVDTGGRSGNPLLASPLQGDYALLPESTAVGAGHAVAEVCADKRGIRRTYGGSPDLGAYESTP
jgi:hypothetical protein